jgi:hypothetical protein
MHLFPRTANALLLQVSEANIARAAAEARQLELERKNSALRLEIAASQASARSTMEEAARLLSELTACAVGFNKDELESSFGVCWQHPLGGSSPAQ